MDQGFFEELKALIGQEESPREAADEVCKPMIRQWCAAMQDANPLYTDEAYAGKSRYSSIIAPPTMLFAWIMPPLWPPSERPPDHFEQVLETLDRAGFHGALATNVSQKYSLPLFPGDHITYTYKVSDVSPEKKTSVGNGHFVTTTFVFINQKGETVGTQDFTVLKYRIG